MSTVLEPVDIESPPDVNGGNNVLDPGPPGGGGGDGRRGGGGFPLRSDPYRAAVWVFLIPVAAFFGGLAHMMVSYRAASPQWVAVPLPPLMYTNTVVLLCSSLALELGRRSMRRGSPQLTHWLWLTSSLGTLFLAGQVHVWQELAGAGTASNAGRAFFYILTMGHGAHLVGALGALAYLSVRQSRGELTLRRQSALSAAAIFWHFMGVLWIGIFALLTR